MDGIHDWKFSRMVGVIKRCGSLAWMCVLSVEESFMCGCVRGGVAISFLSLKSMGFGILLEIVCGVVLSTVRGVGF